jgi:hypothetical protein
MFIGVVANEGISNDFARGVYSECRAGGPTQSSNPENRRGLTVSDLVNQKKNENCNPISSPIQAEEVFHTSAFEHNASHPPLACKEQKKGCYRVNRPQSPVQNLVWLSKDKATSSADKDEQTSVTRCRFPAPLTI